MHSYTSPIGTADTQHQQKQIEYATLTNTGRNSRQGSRRNSLLQALQQQRRSSQETMYKTDEPNGKIDDQYVVNTDTENYKYAKDSTENEKTKSARNSPSLQGRRKSSIRFSDEMPVLDQQTEKLSAYEPNDQTTYSNEPITSTDGSAYESTMYGYTTDSALQPQRLSYDEQQYEQQQQQQQNYDEAYNPNEPSKQIINDSHQYDTQYGDVTTAYDPGVEYTSDTHFEQPIYEQTTVPQQYIRRTSQQYAAPANTQYEQQPYQTSYQVDTSGYTIDPATDSQIYQTDYQSPTIIGQQRNDQIQISSNQQSPSLSSNSESNASGSNLGSKYKGNGRSEQLQQQQHQQQQPPLQQARPSLSKQPSKKKII